MTDSAMMKRVREWLASCVRVATENGVPEDADLEAAALAFIDGEPARIAAAREEQREACADWLEDTALPEAAYSVVREARATPLTATPLADEIAAAREKADEAVRYWTDLAQAEARDAAAARARVAELEAQAKKDDAHALLVNTLHLKEVASLRGRVAWLEAQWDEAVAALVSVEQTAARVADRSLEVFELRHEFRLVRQVARLAVLAKYPEGKR